MNVISITGNLGRNPELRYIPSGKAVCSVSVANTTGWGDKKNTTWFKADCWGKHAEFVNEYGMKGRKVAVTGEMVCRKVDDQFYWKIENARVEFLDRKPDDDAKNLEDAEEIPF